MADAAKVITPASAGGGAGGADPKPKAKSYKKLTFKVVIFQSYTKEEFLAKFGGDRSAQEKEEMWLSACVAYADERENGVLEVEAEEDDLVEPVVEAAIDSWVMDHC